MLRLPRMRRPRSRPRSRGQSLAEFALVFPILMLIVGGIIQFGLIFWAQNTLTQAVRDTGRWAATQQVGPCRTITNLASTADQIARRSSLIGYASGQWAATYVAYADNAALPANPPSTTGLEAVWSTPDASPTCPPSDNSETWFVTIRGSSRAPIFFPWIPGDGNLWSETQFRMEPEPQ
jgi:Flp pilus assembly protein TadG